VTGHDQSLWQGLTVIIAARLEIDPGDYSYSLLLDMAEQPSGGARAVSIQFDGVTDLNLRGVGGGLSQIMGLEVETIKERQLERLNFRVTDFEHGTIAFLCRDYKVVREYTT
jgi:hypothetical protein